MRWFRPLAVYAVAIFTITAGATASADPVTNFIIESDSIARTGSDADLARYVSDNAVLVGAVVGQLVDIAVELGDEGDRAAEKENIDFAFRIAELHRDANASSVPVQLIEVYRRWGKTERGARSTAKGYEAQSKEARGERDFDRAVQLLEQARKIYGEIGDNRSEAVVWGSLGVVHWFAGDFDAVRADYDNALEWRRAIEDRILEGRTLNGLGSLNLQTGDLVAAVDFYEQAVALRRETGDLGGLATSLNYLANAYNQLGRTVDARKTMEAAVPVVEAAGDVVAQVDLLQMIGGINAEMGRFGSAETSYREAIDVARAGEHVSGELWARNNLAITYADFQKYREAMVQLDAVADILAASPEPENQLVMLRNRGIVNMRTGDLDGAREDFIAFIKLADEYEAPLYKMEALINIAYLYRELGALDRAYQSAEAAQAIADTTGSPLQSLQAEMVKARVELLRGRAESAVTHFERALEIANEVDSPEQIRDVRINLAGARINAGDMGGARDEIHELLRESRAAEHSSQVVACYTTLGHSFEDEDPDSAAVYYEKALAELDEASRAVGAAEVRTGSLSAQYRRVVSEVARYYAGQSQSGDDDWSARAFTTIERAKARGLISLMETTVLSDDTADEEAVLDELYSLDSGADDYAERERKLKQHYVDLREARVQNTVGRDVGVTIASLEELRRGLPKKTVMLAYALGDSVSLLWAIDRKGVALYELPDRRQLDDQVRRLRDAVATPGRGDGALRSLARSLYETLVMPAEQRMDGKKELVIVADDVLFELPFEALLTADIADDATWLAMPYLARDFQTLYAPSATIYLRLREGGESGYARDLLAMGDPDFTTLELRPGMVALEPLPYTRSEVERIGERLKDDNKLVLVGADASENRLKETMRNGKPRIVHLATHGLLDPVEPALSSVALTADAEDDGYLYTLEILSMKAEVGLVVMSSCESARGRIGRGEGVVGLSRAFIASGARGIVASLWPVSDESTSELMARFYDRMLGKKRSAGRALQEARLAMMETEEFAHPFYWSAFVVIGADETPW